MFGMVVLFGLTHGLILVPILLSLIGPTNYHEASQAEVAAKIDLGWDNQAVVGVEAPAPVKRAESEVKGNEV